MTNISNSILIFACVVMILTMSVLYKVNKQRNEYANLVEKLNESNKALLMKLENYKN